MVVTRSISGTTKKTDTKIAVNHKVAERANKQTRKKERMNSNMKVTRAKSGTTKKVDTKNAVKPKIFKSINLELIKERNWTIRDDALSLFMMNNFLKRYYEMHPPRPTTGTLPYEVALAGNSEWRHMSASDKALYIELAKKMKAEGRSI